jgi:ferrous iron transport protein A
LSVSDAGLDLKSDQIPAGCPVTEQECSLDCLGHGRKARVCTVDGPNRCRLMELGFTRGTEVEVTRRAAFGGPVLVQLRSYKLSLRREEAEAIRVLGIAESPS